MWRSAADAGFCHWGEKGGAKSESLNIRLGAWMHIWEQCDDSMAYE